MKNWVETTILQWKTENITLRPGASPAQINDTEKMLGYLFPDEFKTLYLQVNGFTDFDWRSNMISIWPLDRIISEYTDSQDKSFIGFADYLINSATYGFLKNETGVFKQVDQYGAQFLTSSFKKAIELINADNKLLY
ncbi:SMI1/KNR4 family protein [Chitinophaga defluvii]|uniref:SMI1/KNR4 family protein n=1 Tax=Chitinophaga defluvii TaxID=3163343 RepID=A0ABV2TCR3_9BACT